MAYKWEIYDYVDHRTKNVIEDWMENDLQKPERARIMRKLDALRKNGDELSTDLLSDTPKPHIKKVRLTTDTTSPCTRFRSIDYPRKSLPLLSFRAGGVRFGLGGCRRRSDS